MARAAPANSRVIALKVGSAIVAPRARLDTSVIKRLADEIARVAEAGPRVLVVSSGAVACGLEAFGMTRPPERIDQRQAAAAAGQPALMAAWSAALASRGLRAAQVLLTADDVDNRARFVNARRTIETLLDAGVVPIINENDSVAFEELRLGDNDRLSALAAGLAAADTLVILSSASGVCEGGAAGRVIPRLDDVEAARAHVTPERTPTGTGGMATKLDAAEAARAMGIDVVIASGAEPGTLERVLHGESVGTLIPAAAPARAGARKHWIGRAVRVRGAIDVDEGARTALVERGASLLPKGVRGVEPLSRDGFGIGAAVELRCGGEAFARGLTSYRSDEIARIAGRRSEEIAVILGYSYCDEVIHRDNLILTHAASSHRTEATT